MPKASLGSNSQGKWCNFSHRQPYAFVRTCGVHTCMHACIHPYIHTCIRTYVRTYVHTYTHTYIHTYTHTHIHTYTHTHIQTYRHTYIHTHIHTYIHNMYPQGVYLNCEMMIDDHPPAGEKLGTSPETNHKFYSLTGKLLRVVSL